MCVCPLTLRLWICREFVSESNEASPTSWRVIHTRASFPSSKSAYFSLNVGEVLLGTEEGNPLAVPSVNSLTNCMCLLFLLLRRSVHRSSPTRGGLHKVTMKYNCGSPQRRIEGIAAIDVEEEEAFDLQSLATSLLRSIKSLFFR